MKNADMPAQAVSAESGKAQPVAGLRIVAWMTERDGDPTFPRMHKQRSEADEWVAFCTVGPRITVRPVYTIDSDSSDPVRAALVEALSRVLPQYKALLKDCGLSSTSTIEQADAALRAAGVEL